MLNKVNHVHQYTNVNIRIIGQDVLVFSDSKLIARDVLAKGINPRTKKIADFYYKKHILKTYDDSNKIKVDGYEGYFPEYFPTNPPIPGMVIRVEKRDVGFGKLNKCLVSASNTPSFKWVFVPKKVNIIDAIKDCLINNKFKV